MSDMANCGLIKDEFVKYVDQIKEQAILAIEKRDKAIAQKDKEIEELQAKLEEEQRMTKNLLVEIKNETKKINNIDKEQEVIKKLIEFLTGLVKNKNNTELEELKEKLNETQTSLIEERKKSSKQMENLTATKEELELEKQENAKKVEELNKKIEELKEHLTQEQEKCRQSEAEKEQVTNELNKLKEDMHYELYEQYCALSDNFKKKFTYIKFSNIFGFFKASSDNRILPELHNFICNDLVGKNAKDGAEVDSLIDFFNALFEAHQSQDVSLKRLDTKERDKYDNRTMIATDTNVTSGSVTKVILAGYQKGEASIQSLVEVK